MSDDLRVIQDRNPPGEHPFTARGLFLSFHLGHYLRLEQQTTDKLWRGSSRYGDVKVMLPGEDRTFRHTRPASFAHLTLAPVRLDQLGIEPSRLRPHAMVREVPLRHLVEALLAETSAGPTSRLFQDGVALAIVARLSALNGRAQPDVGSGLDPRRLKRVLDLVEDRLADDLSVNDLARAVDLSPSHFAAQFTVAVGDAPHRYLTRRRVERARELILRGGTPADAAVSVGFYDQSHLARHMRRLFGVSPAVLRRSARGDR